MIFVRRTDANVTKRYLSIRLERRDFADKTLAIDLHQGLRATGSLQCRINQKALIGGNGARQ
jgi:hypothetical protein